MEEHIEEETLQVPKVRGRHIKKRALKNKALSVSFDERDLKDYVTGFHKRKKKRRKEAEKNQEEAQRRKRLEERKKFFDDPSIFIFEKKLSHIDVVMDILRTATYE